MSSVHDSAIGHSVVAKKAYVIPAESDKLHGFSNSGLYYDMRQKGLAIIFNHERFSFKIRLQERVGSFWDKQRMAKCFQNLNFAVEAYDNLKYDGIIRVMNRVANLDRSQISCLAVVVMTHGKPGTLQAFDYEYAVHELWDGLTADKCPNLIGIPKLYFIQSCRGDRDDYGYTFTDSDESAKQTFTIPSMSDFLHMYSTYDGYTSWRDVDGSWFIQSLCEILEEEGQYWDLLQLLTMVNRKVAYDYETKVNPQDPNSNKMKQIPQIVSMLTKLLKFYPTVESSYTE